MSLRFFIAALLLLFFSSFGYSQEVNYDTARKVYEAGKEVEAYQKAKMDATYVDYSVTPTWVKVVYGGVGIALLGIVGLAWNISRGSDKDEETKKKFFTTEEINKRDIVAREREMQGRVERENAREIERKAAAEAISKMPPAAAKKALKKEQEVEESYQRLKERMELDFEEVVKKLQGMTPFEREANHRKNLEAMALRNQKRS